MDFENNMEIKIGFIVNPIAGMGGKVGLKGTDGVYKKALDLGAKPVAFDKATDTLVNFKKTHSSNKKIKWVTCAENMGKNELLKSGLENIDVVYETKKKNTDSNDTKDACKEFIKQGVDLILFCGGDGTARDIFEIVKNKIPILGIPSGVKMHSAVFGINTEASSKMLDEFIKEKLTIGDAEIMDLDEELYRKGKWNIKLFGVAKSIVEPTYVQVGKTSFESVSDNLIKDELAEHIEEELEKNKEYLFLFGSGGTINYIAEKLKIKNTLLGIDAVYNKKTIAQDLNEKDILALIKKYPKVKLLLSPIGAQGFILGRGNLQLSPKVIKKIDIDNIIVIATPSKISNTPLIRVDTGDKKLDEKFKEKEFLMIVIGYRLSRVIKIMI